MSIYKCSYNLLQIGLLEIEVEYTSPFGRNQKCVIMKLGDLQCSRTFLYQEKEEEDYAFEVIDDVLDRLPDRVEIVEGGILLTWTNDKNHSFEFEFWGIQTPRIYSYTDVDVAELKKIIEALESQVALLLNKS